jgi:cobalt/nickel transport system ATP-binding protein
VIATHDLDLAARVADRICLVKNGSVFAEGTPAEVFYDPALIADAGLKVPQIVRLYLEYCALHGIEPTEHPIRMEELLAVLRKNPKG